MKNKPKIPNESQKSKILWKYRGGVLFKWKNLTNDENRILFANNKNDLIVKTNTNELIFLEYLNPIKEYDLALSAKVLVKPGNFIDIGEPLTEGIIDIHELLAILFHYHLILDGLLIGTLRSLTKFQLLLVNSIQSIYQSQGVNISSKHIEIIVKQMTSKVLILEGGDTPFLPGEFVRISLINDIYQALKLTTQARYKVPKYEPLLLSATNSSLSKDGFLSAAGFQETRRVLTKAAIEGSSDWLRGLKECIIIGRLIPAGSAFLNYKHYLDNVYLFKDL
jgi:DNA-directed RNA polymerase subunit beta'